MTSEEVAQLQKYWAEGNGDQWEAKTSLELLAHADALRARLEETEKERDALRLALVEVTDQHAKRRGEVLAAQMVEKAAQDRAEAAEAKLEKSLRLLKYAFECHLPGQEKKRLCGGCLIEIDRFLSPEPLRTEGAPKPCGHIVCGSLGAEPCLVEGAPKQEESDEEIELEDMPEHLMKAEAGKLKDLELAFTDYAHDLGVRVNLKMWFPRKGSRPTPTKEDENG